jgi:NAD(P)-dependent dehydrogenase (short-subunit alcohol dehydrogenase family)
VDLFSLRGEVALVTGAGSGIGQRLAIGLAEAGADVACLDLPQQAEQLATTAERVRGLGRRALVLTGDVTNAADLAAAVDAVEHELGALSIGLNCAGIANAAPAEDMPYEQWRRVHAINVDGVFLSCQAQARVMLPRRKGAIVNIASMSGSIVNRGLLQAHYNSSKAAVIHMSKSLAMEWAERGVRVNSISPGYTATPMNLRPEVAEQVKEFERDTPLGRMASVDEMVGPAVFLSSRAASFCTGVDLVVDGGFVCW